MEREECAEKESSETRAQRELYQGFGSGQSGAFELAVTPVILSGIGYLVDRWLGIVPVATIVLFLVGIVGLSARLWYGYDARMRAHEASGPWSAG